MIVNDCQLNEMFENYSKYAEGAIKIEDIYDVVDAFQMSSTLAILLNTTKEDIMMKYIQWYNTYKM